jgi:hypothetical protein
MGTLPQPRPDLAVATISNNIRGHVSTTDYVVGGYDGTRYRPSVLATMNGKRFVSAGTLPVPVRYPAVLAERPPNGPLMVNDDYRDRVVVIDPTINGIVWQYSLTDTSGASPGLISIRDAFDLLEANGTTSTHPQTGCVRVRSFSQMVRTTMRRRHLTVRLAMYRAVVTLDAVPFVS